MKTTALFSVLFAATFLVPIHSRAETPPAPQFDAAKLAAIPEKMKAFVDQKEVAGAVTLVATREKVVHFEAVGQADIDKNTPLRPDAIFWIASMTKPVTGAAVLILQDEGKLSVEDPVSKFIPELAGLKTKDGKPVVVTLRHMLTHSSGMDNAGETTKAAKTLADLVPGIAAKPLHFEPGAKWEYCQSGINMLGRVVEVVSGKSFTDFLQARLFDPLGMPDTSFYLSAAQLPRLATPYKRTVDGKLEPAAIFLLEGHDATFRDRYPAANGGLFSTAGDYGKFCRMLLNGGSLDGKVYLKPETVRAMGTVQSGDLKTGFTEGNGWGWGACVVRKPQGVTAMLSEGTFGHGGAYGTQAWIDPKAGVAYVLMVQRANFPNADNSDVRKAFQESAAGAIAK